MEVNTGVAHGDATSAEDPPNRKVRRIESVLDSMTMFVFVFVFVDIDVDVDIEAGIDEESFGWTMPPSSLNAI